MRIFLLLAAAGAAAIATAAPARPPGKSTGSGAWASGGGHRAVGGWQGRSRVPMARGHRGRDRHDDRHGRPRRDVVYFNDGGIAAPTGIVAPYGNGFFAGGGGEVRLRGSRPHYDYDRSYPYEFAARAGARPDRDEEAYPPEPRPRCALEHGVRVCRGW